MQFSGSRSPLLILVSYMYVNYSMPTAGLRYRTNKVSSIQAA